MAPSKANDFVGPGPSPGKRTPGRAVGSGQVCSFWCGSSPRGGLEPDNLRNEGRLPALVAWDVFTAPIRRVVTSLTIDSKPRPLGGTAAADPDPRDSAGLLLGRLTALPALVFAAFMLAGFPLLLFGYFRPIPVLVLWAALAVLVVPYVWRRVPSVTGAAVWGTAGQGGAKPTPRWA